MRITFTGDVHLGPAYSDEEVFGEDIRHVCQRSDYVVINVEGPITNGPSVDVPGVALHSSPQSASVLTALGRNVLNLANNHILDHGVQGLRDTFRFAEDRGWPCVGAGEDFTRASTPCILDRNGITVGILGVCWLGVPFAGKSSPGVFGDSPESHVQRKIRELKRRARWVVVVYHGGEEFTHIPLPGRRRKLVRYISYGADVVVAHHAHCVQRYERVGDGYIFYGLGNLVFDLEQHRRFDGTDESVLLALSFWERSVGFSPFYTRQDCNRRCVSRIPENHHFSEVTEDSYRQEWGAEASRRLRSYWVSGHEGLARSTWRQQATYCWKKCRRVAGMVYACAFDKYGLTRPYIVGGAVHHVRNMFRAQDDRGTAHR